MVTLEWLRAAGCSDWPRRRRSWREVPPRREVCSTASADEPAVLDDVPLPAGQAETEDDLQCEPPGVRDAEPVQGVGHHRPRLRLGAEARRLVADLHYLQAVIGGPDEQLTGRQDRVAS